MKEASFATASTGYGEGFGYSSTGTAQDGYFYIHADFQGSWLAVSNAANSVTNRYAYDAWGRPRDYQTWYLKTVGITTPVATLAALQPRFDRGYTGHEHMAAFGLINMNGRIYDPYLQRFLSPDPYIQDPDDAQNYNRYSYCLNNPLMFTDPSGYSFKSWIKKAAKKVGNVVKDVVKVTVVGVVLGPVAYVCYASQYIVGDNFASNAADYCMTEISLGLCDPTYYWKRLGGDSRSQALNGSIIGDIVHQAGGNYSNFRNQHDPWGFLKGIKGGFDTYRTFSENPNDVYLSDYKYWDNINIQENNWDCVATCIQYVKCQMSGMTTNVNNIENTYFDLYSHITGTVLDYKDFMNEGVSPNYFYNIVDNYFETKEICPEMTNIARAIKENHSIIASVLTGAISGHCIVIVGYNDSNDTVIYQDPSYGCRQRKEIKDIDKNDNHSCEILDVK